MTPTIIALSLFAAGYVLTVVLAFAHLHYIGPSRKQRTSLVIARLIAAFIWPLFLGLAILACFAHSYLMACEQFLEWFDSGD